MKTKLLFLLFFTSLFSWAQSIASFHGANNSVFEGLTSATALDHSPTGQNQTWTFDNMVSLGNLTYTYVAPTASELTTYPGTTEVSVATDTNGSTNIYTKTAANVFSITGLTGTDLNINFSTNNATLGAFPMAYGFTNSDTVSGTYNYTTYSGTFSGTLTTTVDATGFLNLPQYFYSSEVVRLKTVLNISLNYSIFSNVGTVTQTSYSYYDGGASNNPAFRSVTTAAVVALLNINQNNTSLERFVSVLLNTPDNAYSSLWVKNPVQNGIEINSSSAIDNATISVTDLLGKTIFESKNININGAYEIPATLNKGMYFLTVGNEKGSTTKKIIKN